MVVFSFLPSATSLASKTHKPVVLFNINSNYAKTIKIIEKKLSTINIRKEIKYNKGQERTVIVQLLQRIGLADRTPKALATYIA